MQMVYAVESGEYSDYSVSYIFATRELAQDAVDKINRESYHDAEVVERPLLDEPLKVAEVHTVTDRDGGVRHWTYRNLLDQTDTAPNLLSSSEPNHRGEHVIFTQAYSETAARDEYARLELEQAKARHDRLARERAEAAGIG